MFNIRIAYDISKTIRRCRNSGKAYTDKDFARDYLIQSYSMVSKVLSGEFTSKPVMSAIIQFINDTEPRRREVQSQIDKLLENNEDY